MTVMLHNRQSSFMDQIQPVYRAGVLTKCAWKRTGCLMDLCLALLRLEILSLCCRQRCYFRLPGFSSTIWTEHFVLKPLWEVTNRRMELPVYFKYYMQTKTRYQVIYPSHELHPLPGLALLAGSSQGETQPHPRLLLLAVTSLGEAEPLFLPCACVITEVGSPGWGGGPLGAAPAQVSAKKTRHAFNRPMR